MGFPPADVAALVTMVQHHLLLPDVATRRDLDDPGTIDLVAKAAGDVPTLRLLAALTEGDSLATGPAAWGGWKAQLVRDLVERTAHVLEGGSLADVPRDEFPTAEHLRQMAAGAQVLDGRDDTLTVITVDRPGVFSGSPACSPSTASACSMPMPTAPTRCRRAPAWPSPGSASSPPSGRWSHGTGWSRDLEAAFGGRLALTARLARAGPHLRRAPQHLGRRRSGPGWRSTTGRRRRPR